MSRFRARTPSSTREHDPAADRSRGRIDVQPPSQKRCQPLGARGARTRGHPDDLAMRRRILSVVGARPNFIKVAPVHRALAGYEDVESRILHTGQHYDRAMSDVFFEELDLPRPEVYLGVGSGSHAEQTAAIMVAFEQHVVVERPALVAVYGDVNSTVACALVCAKLGIPLPHVEAGLRSFDRSMPQESNR